jgi:hypothetical protein
MATRKQNVKVTRIAREHHLIDVAADERHVPDIESIEGVTWVHHATEHSDYMVFYDGRYDPQEIAKEIEQLNVEPTVPDVFNEP